MCRASRCRRARRARRCPREVPLADATFNVAHAATLALGLAQRRPGADRARPARTASTSRAARQLYPRSMELVERAQELGALGATISGAGPDGAVLGLLRADRRARRAAARGGRRLGRGPAAQLRRAWARTWPSSSGRRGAGLPASASPAGAVSARGRPPPRAAPPPRSCRGCRAARAAATMPRSHVIGSTQRGAHTLSARRVDAALDRLAGRRQRRGLAERPRSRVAQHVCAAGCRARRASCRCR